MLEYINDPNDIKQIQPEDYKLLAKDIRRFLLRNVSRTCLLYTSKENLWNSSRNADMKYIPGKTYTVTLDGFIISDNVKCDMYKNINTGYSYSDHDPVYVKFELNKESVLNKFKLKN